MSKAQLLTNLFPRKSGHKDRDHLKSKLTGKNSVKGFKKIGSPKNSTKIKKLKFGSIVSKPSRGIEHAQKASIGRTIEKGRSPIKARVKASKVTSGSKNKDIRKNFGHFSRSIKKDSLSGLLERNRSVNYALPKGKAPRKISDHANFSKRKDSGKARQPVSQLRKCQKRKGASDSQNKNFFSFTQGISENKQSFINNDADLAASTDLFSQQLSKMNQKITFTRKSKDKNEQPAVAPLTPEDQNKKLNRFKSLKNLGSADEPESLKQLRQDLKVESQSPSKLEKIRKSKKGARKYQMKNSFQDIFKKKYSHQNKFVDERTFKLQEKSSIKNKNSPQKSSKLISVKEIQPRKMGTKLKSRTKVTPHNLNSIFQRSQSNQNKDQESSVNDMDNTFLNHFSLNRTKEETTILMNTSVTENSKIRQKLFKSKTPDAPLETTSYSELSPFAPTKPKNKRSQTEQTDQKKDNSKPSNSNKKESARNRSFKRLFMPKFSATSTQKNDKVKKRPRKVDKKLSKRSIAMMSKRKIKNGSDLESQLMQNKPLLEKYKAQNDPDQTIEIFKSSRKQVFDLEKQSIETFKDMRGNRNRDSVDTAKEERSFAKSRNGKMVTICEVLGSKGTKTKGSKKAKTVRTSEESSGNLQSRIQILKKSVDENKPSQIKKPSKNTEDIRKRKKGFGINRSFNNRLRKINKKQSNRMKSPEPNHSTTIALPKRNKDLTDTIYSQTYYMTDLEHYLNKPQNSYNSQLFRDHLKENMTLVKYTLSEYHLDEPTTKVQIPLSPGKNNF